jgi:hypothetical protein
MRSMTVQEARDSFDRMLETAKREGVVLGSVPNHGSVILCSLE